MIFKTPSLFALSLLATALAGCSVTTLDVAKSVTTHKEEIKTIEAETARQQAPKPGLVRVAGNFLGSQPIATSAATRLPSHLRDVTLSFGPGNCSLPEAVANVTKATGLKIRLAADAFSPAFTPAAITPDSEPSIAPMPSPMPGVAAIEAPRRSVNTGPIPRTFRGDLTDYFDQIAATTSLNWVYENGEVRFFRLVTKQLMLEMSPGNIAYRDDVSSGSASNGDSTFSSSATASVEAQLSPWQGVEDAIKALLSPEGKAHINQSSGVIVVTDTKANVDRVTDYVRSENELSMRQVRVEMREILVEESGSSAAGLDVSLVYTRLLNSGYSVDGLATTPQPNYDVASAAPSTLVETGSGSMKVNFGREGYFQGSNIVAQALNGVGKVVASTSRTVLTTNRAPGKVQEVTDRAYLAKTEPGQSTTEGGGVPGLTPGLITYGDSITVVPTIRNNGEVLMQLFSTRSSLIELASVSAGEGSTFQQITTPVLSRKKSSQNFRVRAGETLLIVSNVSNSLDSSDRQGLTGASTKANRKRVMSVLLVTPHVL